MPLHCPNYSARENRKIFFRVIPDLASNFIFITIWLNFADPFITISRMTYLKALLLFFKECVLEILLYIVISGISPIPYALSTS